MNNKRAGLEWILKHFGKRFQEKEQPVVTYDHINLKEIKSNGYVKVNETKNYILLVKPSTNSDYITYNKNTHSAEGRRL